MKLKILGIAILCLVFSCTETENDFTNLTYEIVPIESVEMPELFTINKSYAININYIKPSSCHSFNDVYIDATNFELKIAVITAITSLNNCAEIAETKATHFNFRPTEYGTYTFKFWNGTDENNEDVYLNYNVSVLE